jgi:hypothetical protein
MAKKKGDGIRWLDEVEEHDYPAAESYLLLIYGPARVKRLIAGLRAAKITEFKAKDIFRASQLSLLGISNVHVERDRWKIRDGEELSPLLLVRDENNGKMTIADGYHRLCAIYSFSEDVSIRCKIV